MAEFIQSVKRLHPGIVEDVLRDPELTNDQQEVCRRAWELDQRRNTLRSRTNRWSLFTIRLGLAIFTRSPKAYQDVCSFSVFKLPSISTLRNYISKNYRSEEGQMDKDMDRYLYQYDQRNEESKEKGCLPGLKLGLIIFDETKVLPGKISYNTYSHEITGFAVDHSQLTGVKDLFTPELDPPVSDNMLLFMWRDLTSRFSMLGPFFFSNGAVPSSEIIQHLLSYLGLLADYGFKTLGVVCDGATINQSVIKELCNITSAVPDLSEADPLKLDPSFVNPCDPNSRVNFIICPTHQLKNMINILFKSGEDKENPEITRSFEYDGIHFGADALQQLYLRQRECRLSDNICLKGLHKVYFFRDSWVKMMMSAAVIFVSDRVIGELEGYFEETGDSGTGVTTKYLRAFQKIFLKGIISKKRIRGMDSPVLENISLSGFVLEWYIQASASTSNDSFLSQTTFFLLRVMIYGFRGLCQEFFNQVGEQPAEIKQRYYISPLKVNGSAIESIFGQLRWQAGHSLTPASAVSAYTCLKLRDAIRASRIGGMNLDDGYKSDEAVREIGDFNELEFALDEGPQGPDDDCEDVGESDLDDWDYEF